MVVHNIFDRDDTSSSAKSRLGDGIEGRVNLLPDKEFREQNDALRIDNGKDEEGKNGLRLLPPPPF